MKVVYSNGTEGFLSAEESKELHITNRYSKESWQELEDEMNRLDIIEFEDPLVSLLSGTLVHISYIQNQIAAH